MPVTPEGIQALRILRGKADPVNGVAIPEGGCIGEADRKLAQGAGRLKRVGSDVHSQLNFVLGLQADAEKMAEGDSRVQAVTRRWSACMRRSGYSYRAPGDAIMDKRWSDEEDSPVTPRGDQYRRRGRAMPA